MFNYYFLKVKHKINSSVTSAASRDESCSQLFSKSANDLQLCKEAHGVQENLSRTGTQLSQQHTIQLVIFGFKLFSIFCRHIVNVIREYDTAITHYQEVVEQLTVKLNDIMNGKVTCQTLFYLIFCAFQTDMSTTELKEYFLRFDAIFSGVATKVFEGNSKLNVNLVLFAVWLILKPGIENATCWRTATSDFKHIFFKC